ncbi:hypothetical protein HD806DRAFT_516885 [Xylariaceae sp. AK1471]|nr:hypothetical protein HD806DRAFT_516885 [Xylariaceae sp. AK1471]
MSRPSPSVPDLSRLNGRGRITDVGELVPNRPRTITYSVIDVGGDKDHRHTRPAKQLVPYKRPSRDHYTHTATAARQLRRPQLRSDLRDQGRGEFNQSTYGAAHSRTAQGRVLTQRHVDGVWDPAQSRDLTVHLKMNIQEDLDEILEEFCCLQRLGDFNSARSYFEANLEGHVEQPYVLVQYGEMLLEQGDYLSIANLGPINPYHQVEQSSEHHKPLLLSDYWDIILFWAACHYIHPQPRKFTFKRENFRLLHDNLMQSEGYITSTEIKYLSLVYRLCGLRHLEIVKNGLNRALDTSFPPAFHRELYQCLLRQGRIWDLRDIIVARMETGSPWTISESWSTNPDFHLRLSALVTDWTNATAEYDTPTFLALLDILTSLVSRDDYSDIVPSILTVATQVARSVISNDANAMKTRPFTEWILTECENAQMGGFCQLERQEYHLDISPGVHYRRSRRNLVQYAPYKTETPGWVCEDGPPELLNSARLALRTSTELGDYQTQAKALQQLILLSANPFKEFEELGTLQKLSQGDNFNLSETLATKYLLSNDDKSKKRLRDELAGQWSIPGFSSGFSAHQLWVLSMIRYALARDDVEAECALREAEGWYENSSPQFIEYVNKKMPTQPYARWSGNKAQTARSVPADRRNNQRKFSVSPGPEPQPSFGLGVKAEDIEDSVHERQTIQKGGGRWAASTGPSNDWSGRTPMRTFGETRVRIDNVMSSPAASPSRLSPPRTIRGPTIEREVITHYRGIEYVERSHDLSPFVRGRTIQRDMGGNRGQSSLQQRQIIKKDRSETQRPEPMRPNTAGASIQNTRNVLGQSRINPIPHLTHSPLPERPQPSTSSTFKPSQAPEQHGTQDTTIHDVPSRDMPKSSALRLLRPNFLHATDTSITSPQDIDVAKRGSSRNPFRSRSNHISSFDQPMAPQKKIPSQNIYTGENWWGFERIEEDTPETTGLREAEDKGSISDLTVKEDRGKEPDLNLEASPESHALMILEDDNCSERDEEDKDTHPKDALKYDLANQSTLFDIGYRTELDRFKPPSRTVTIENVRDVGEDTGTASFLGG